MQLTLGRYSLDLTRPRVMGVLNVTPDSFSDGGDFADRDQALRHAVSMAEAGASIIDIGGESTRPGAAPVDAAQEIDRILPVIDAIRRETDVLLSVDTSKPQVMREAVAAGAVMINDVRALRADGALEAAASLDVVICLMHMLGTPGTMQVEPEYRTLPGDVLEFLADRVGACEQAGIVRSRLLIDPGFGFGKTDRHNLCLLSTLDAFKTLALPVVIGISRKRTLGNITGRTARDRTAAGLAAAVLAVERGAHIVRTHDVAATVDAMAVIASVREHGN